MLVGIHENQSYEDSLDTYPLMRIVREFVGGEGPTDLAAKVSALTFPAFAAGLVPCVSFKPPIAVSSGGYDSELSRLRTYLETVSNPVWLAIYHEPEDNMSGAAYRDMFQYVRGFLQSRPNVTYVYSANSFTWRPGDTRTADPTPWGQVAADVFAVDAYSGRSWPLDSTMWEQSWWDRWFAMVNGRPWAVTERGWYSPDQDPARVASIRREAEGLANREVPYLPIGYVYWNTPGAEQDPGLLMPEATAAIQEGMELLAPTAPTPPTPAGHVVIDYGQPRRIVVDGVEFPWLTTGPVTVDVTPSGTPTVTITMPVTGVEIRNAPPVP